MQDSDDMNPYRGAVMTLLTMHGKERAVGPALVESLGATLRIVDDVDTDKLGTFTRDIPRSGTQREAAFLKVALAAERNPFGLGLGSEGTFLPGPLGLGSWNVEMLAFVDRGRGIEILGRAAGPGRHHHAAVESRDALEAFARRSGFPEHGLVLRPAQADDPRILKGLKNWEDLGAAFEEVRKAAPDRKVFVEHDLRAHMHPTRMALVGEATRDLVVRLLRLCPACGTPGYGVERKVPGLVCAWCHAPTSEPRAEEYACVACPHREIKAISGPKAADPGRCSRCNP